MGYRSTLEFLLYDWFEVALVSLGAASSGAAREGRLRACRYFFHYELPKIRPWLAVVQARDQTCADMPLEAL